MGRKQENIARRNERIKERFTEIVKGFKYGTASVKADMAVSELSEEFFLQESTIRSIVFNK